MAQLSSRLTISLLDRISGPARGIAGVLGRLRSASRGALGGNLGENAARGVTLLHGRLIAATAAAYGLNRALKGAVSPAAAFETKLLDIAQKADLSDAGMAAMGGRIRKLAKEVGRGAGDVAGGVDVLMGMGMDADGAMNIMPTIMKGATAYGAEIEDLAKAGMATMTSLNVKASEFSQALDAMAYAGKAGAFELKEMARYLPSLAAQAGGLKMGGLHGVSDIAAALQAVRKNAGTSEEAATRLSDVFGKLTSDQTVKNFKKVGIKDFAGDLRKAQAAAAKAKKPFSAIDFLVENLNKALKGDIGRVGEIFSDKEAKAGATALMQHYKELKRIREEAFKANGTTEADFQRRMKTYDAQMRRFKGAVEDVSISIGNRLLPGLTALASHFAGRLNGMEKSVNIFDRMKFAAEGFLSAFGSSGLSDLFAKLENFVFGDPAQFEEDLRGLSKIFQQFREWGVWTRDLAGGVGDLVARLSALTGLDTSTLATIAGYGAKFAIAAAGFALLAGAIRKVGSALLFLSGLKLAFGVLKMLAKVPQLLRAPPPLHLPGPAPNPAAKPTVVPPSAGSPSSPPPFRLPGGASPSGPPRLPTSVPTVGKGAVRGFGVVNEGFRINPWSMVEMQKRFAEMTAKQPSAPSVSPSAGGGSLMGKLGGVMKNGLWGAAVQYLGQKAIDLGLDGVDKGFGLDTSRRVDPGTLPTLKRLLGRMGIIEPESEGRTPERSADITLDTVGKKWAPGAADKSEPREVTIAGQSIAQLLQPRGTQDVKVTNPPQIHAPISITITATTNASPADIGIQVGAAVKRAVQGTYTDGGT